MFTLENQLWLWLRDCDDRKPRHGTAALEADDKVVRLLQDGSVRGREAGEDGDPIGLTSLNLQ